MSFFGTLERSSGSQGFAGRFGRPFTYLAHKRHQRGPSVSSALQNLQVGCGCMTCRNSRLMDNFFINALIQAGFCKEHAPRRRHWMFGRSYSTDERARRKEWGFDSHERNVLKPMPRGLRSVKRPTKGDYLNLVECYYELPYLRRNEPVAALSSLSRPPNDEEEESCNKPLHSLDGGDDVWQPRSFYEATAIKRFLEMLVSEDVTQDILYEQYIKMPRPGVAYLSLPTIRQFLQRMEVVPKTTEQAMLRFLLLMQDMKEAEIPLTTSEWNSAINLVGRCFRRYSTIEMKNALSLWSDMEHDTGRSSNIVTFNILLDVAVKSRKFALAEMILKEIDKRGLEFNRWSYTALIFYHGLAGDGDRVRKAYKKMVEAGHIVDMYVVNCVMSAFIHAGEPSSAEQLYERVKSLLANVTGTRPHFMNWKETRELGKMLDKAARLYRHDEEGRKKVQDEQVLIPNSRTYRILLHYHASQSGEMDRVISLLDDMQYFGVPLHGEIYMELFAGFATHGGIRYTTWTKSRLESVWASFLQALENGVPDVKLGDKLVIWVLRAFGKCAGRERAFEIWAKTKSKWDPNMEQTGLVMRTLLRLDAGAGDWYNRSHNNGTKWFMG